VSVVILEHAAFRMKMRGTNEEEVREAVASGEAVPAKHGRVAYRKDFPYNGEWGGKTYRTKQVMPVTVKENDALLVVTVYVFYF
jgi:hypothetical protein